MLFFYRRLAIGISKIIILGAVLTLLGVQFILLFYIYSTLFKFSFYQNELSVCYLFKKNLFGTGRYGLGYFR